jgi:hypothetical protein
MDAIETDEGKEFFCPSLHHQMMHPWPRAGHDGVPDFKMIAWCPTARSSVYYVEPDEEDMSAKSIVLQGPEPEIIYIPGTKSLCIQSHPEFIREPEHKFVQYCLSLTKKYLLPDADIQQIH